MDGSDAVRVRMSGLEGWMSGLEGRMSGVVGCPGIGPDVRARDPWMNSRNSAWRGQIRGKIRKILWMEFGEKMGES